MAESFTVDEVNAGPEFAAQNALLEASFAIEDAIHATSATAMITALTNASGYLHWALDDLALVGNEDQLAAATALSSTVDGLVAGGLPAGTALATFQLQLLPLQSQVVEVASVPSQQAAAADNTFLNSENLALAGVFGTALFVALCASFIDYKQTHGGYHRGAPGVARPLVAYRYPRR